MTVARFPRSPAPDQTPAERAADLMAQAAQIGVEQTEALIAALAEARRLAEELDANTAARVGEREIGRQVALKVAPYLTTLLQMRARA